MIYRCTCCYYRYRGKPVPNVFHSSPTKNPPGRDFTGDRIHLIESSEGYLLGICSNTDELAHFKPYEK
jgi:hypothetical protein